VADKFRKVGCLNVYDRKPGRVDVKQYMDSFYCYHCLLEISFFDCMSKLFPVRDCSLFIVQGETEQKLYSYNIFSLPPS
jgi:hypothetical protein